MDTRKLVTRLYAAFKERDISTLTEICSPNITWTQNPGFPGGQVSVGVAEIIANVFDKNSKNWKQFEFCKENMISNGDTVLVQGAYIVIGMSEQRFVKAQTAHVFKIENNKVISFQQYTDTKILWDSLSKNEQ